MKMFRYILIALAAVLCPSFVEAATCFWVGGSATWSTANAASWASSSGGTASTCAATGGIPKQAADTATFDALSGGGTVTVDTTINGVTLTQITMGAFTGTLDFSVNNPSLTMNSFSVTGTGTRTLKLGSGTFTLTAPNSAVWDATTVTNFTLNAGTSTLTVSGTPNNSRFFIFGAGLTYANITVSSPNAIALQFTGNSTITTLTLTPPLNVNPLGPMTITNALNIAGTGFNNAVSIYNLTGAITWTLTGGGTFNWTAIGNMTFTGSPTATNSLDLKGNSGITITGPSGGGGGHIIGG